MRTEAGSHPTWLELDAAAVAQNCRHALRDTGTPLMAVVKADAYGHGAVAVARAAVAGGASWLGVARCGEALELRRAGLEAPILVLGVATPEEVDQALAAELSLTLPGPEVLALFAARAGHARRPLRVHAKLDTGFGRLGVLPEEAVPFLAEAGRTLHVEGVFSHLAAAEEEENPLSRLQTERFGQALQALVEAGLRPRWAHLANSAGAFFHPAARFDLVRLGNVVLGLRIRTDRPLPGHYRPALAWKARLASCRRLPVGWGVGYGSTYCAQDGDLIGVVPVGYGDGLRRVPGNAVLVGGRRCPVLGRLCLDQLMVRLPEPFPVGEEVVVLGSQGGEAIALHDLAMLYGTTQVDISTHIHARVPRILVEGPRTGKEPRP